jgi:amino acid permease
MPPSEGIKVSALEEGRALRNVNSTATQPDVVSEEISGEYEPQFVPSSESFPQKKAREFRARHIQMMALGIVPQCLSDISGSTIGTSLLFSVGGQLYNSGPVSLLLAYLLVGSLVYAVLVLVKLLAIH